MQLPPREPREDSARVELPTEEPSSTPGCSSTAPELRDLVGHWRGFAQSPVRSRQDGAVPCMEHTGTQLHANTPVPYFLEIQPPALAGLGCDSLGVKPQLSHWCPSPLQQTWPEAEEKALHQTHSSKCLNEQQERDGCQEAG